MVFFYGRWTDGQTTTCHSSIRPSSELDVALDVAYKKMVFTKREIIFIGVPADYHYIDLGRAL